MSFQLEKYRGTRSRHTCPNCGKKKEFARYIDECGEYLDDRVGRCNRESSCGYHLTPKEFLGSDAPRRPSRPSARKTITLPAPSSATERFDTIDNSLLLRSLEHTPKNRLLNFLLTFIDPVHIERIVKDYFIAATKDGKTVFWQIDAEGRARTGKIISYDERTGKRDKSVNPSWIHYELKKAKLLPESFTHRLCFFGEHLLRRDKRKTVAIVEAEKTAVVASLFIDSFIWLACGGKSYLKAEKLMRFKDRRIILYPDADGFARWSAEAEEARKLGLDVSVSEIVENAASEEEKRSGFDLADYLICQESNAVKYNLDADAYNAKVDTILNDEALTDLFNELYEERLAITECNEPDMQSVREIVEYIACLNARPP